MGGTPSRVRATSSLSVTRSMRPRITRVTQATVLFADLRGYTGLAEALAPGQIIPLLDEFIHVLASAAASHGGQVFHVAGDGMMAGFGVDTAAEEGARSALAAGHTMLSGFAPLAARWREELSIDTGIGIGLHMGEVALGLLGPPGKRHPTLVGDTVNVAARLCGRARAGEVLLSCTVASAVKAHRAEQGSQRTPFLQLPQFELKGRRAPLDIWCVPAAERLAVT